MSEPIGTHPSPHPQEGQHVPAYGEASPSHGQPSPAYGQPFVPVEPAPLSALDERNWAVAAHLSGFVAAYVALGFLGPLTVLLIAGHRSPYVRHHAVEALNFNLSILLWLLVSALLVIVLIGIPMLVAVGVTYVVAVVLGAVAAGRGESYRYPLTIRFVH